MIPIFEKMNLNTFKKVCIPKPKNLFARYGFRYTNNGSSDSSSVEMVCSSRNKLDEIMSVNNELYKRYSDELASRAKQSVESSVEQSVVEN